MRKPEQTAPTQQRIFPVVVVAILFSIVYFASFAVTDGPETATLTSQDVAKQYIHDPDPNSGGPAPF